MRRTGRASGRFLGLRVALFFFAAGLWFAGVIIDDRRITGVALAVAIGGIILGLVGRRGGKIEEAMEPEDAELE